MRGRESFDINVIDLFAGPGGLGEGFSAFRTSEGRQPFRVRMSVEKEASAHATLTLRAFLRQFGASGFPGEYETFRQGRIGLQDLHALYPRQAGAAFEETMGGPVELGHNNRTIFRRFRQLFRETGDSPWVVIGGPPCQAYSLAGRSRNRGKRDYRPEKDERNFLYREYLRVLAHVHPEVFVMENVRGMLSAKVGGRRIFDDILADLSRPGRASGVRTAQGLEYRIHSLVASAAPDELSPEDYLIRSERYGVPQARHRVILLGIRSDIERQPGVLTPSRPVSVLQTISRLPRLRSRISRGRDVPDAWAEAIHECWRQALRPGSGIPSSVLRVMRRRIRELDPGLPVVARSYPGGRAVFGPGMSRALRNWLIGAGGCLIGHETRGHMPSDLARYFFASCWAEAMGGISPRADEYPDFLAPAHANWASGKFADRFRVQAANGPATTITSHIAKDGHYYIHPDPVQCRSLTPREAARLQTFPDDYHFVGNRTQQYHQIGNAVPPWLALQIARIVHDVLG